MGVSGVGSNSGASGAGINDGVSCSASVANDETTATTVAEKNCLSPNALEAQNVKAGINKADYTANQISKLLSDPTPISRQPDMLTAPNFFSKEIFSASNMTTTTKFSTDKITALSTDKFTKPAPATVSYTAKSGANYDVRSGIQVTAAVEAKMNELANKVYEQTNRKITFSSGYRGPARQARAMYDNVVMKGLKDFNKYAQKDLAQEIKDAYLANAGNKEAAISAMTDVIQAQVDRGKYISSHLRSNAVDISGIDKNYFKTIRGIVTEMGGTSLNEGDHLHVQF